MLAGYQVGSHGDGAWEESAPGRDDSEWPAVRWSSNMFKSSVWDLLSTYYIFSDPDEYF